MIHVIATIQLKPGMRGAFLERFHALVPVVRAEAGCIEYGPAVDAVTDIPNQAPVREDTVVVIEKWEDLDALKAHLDAPHMHQYRGEVREMVAGTELRILEPA